MAGAGRQAVRPCRVSALRGTAGAREDGAVRAVSGCTLSTPQLKATTARPAAPAAGTSGTTAVRNGSKSTGVRTHSYTQSHTARVRATSVADRNAAQLASRARVSVRARAGSLSLGPNRAGPGRDARPGVARGPGAGGSAPGWRGRVSRLARGARRGRGPPSRRRHGHELKGNGYEVTTRNEELTCNGYEVTTRNEELTCNGYTRPGYDEERGVLLQNTAGMHAHPAARLPAVISAAARLRNARSAPHELGGSRLEVHRVQIILHRAHHRVDGRRCNVFVAQLALESGAEDVARRRAAHHW